MLTDGRSALAHPGGTQSEHAAARSLGIATYIGVPVVSRDGTMAGTLCGASRTVRDVPQDAIAAMELCARLVADNLGAAA